MLWLAAGAFAARLAIGWALRRDTFWEGGYDFFFTLARHIAAGDGISLGAGPTAFRVPGYPLFLAAITLGEQVALPVLIAQSLVGAGTVFCAGILAQEFFGRRAGVIAAAATAGYPYFVIHDTALQETSLFTLLSILSVVFLVRCRRTRSKAYAVAAGAALGATVLTRANLLPFAVLAPLCVAIGDGRDNGRWRLAAVCAATFLIALSPWLARSYHLTGSPQLTTQAGFFLWLGNNEHTFSRYPHDSIDRSQEIALAASTDRDRAEQAALRNDELAIDRWYRDKALAFILAHPIETIRSAAYKVASVFCWLPSPRHGFWSNLIVAASYGPIMLLAIAGMWMARREWRDHLAVYVQFATFAAVTAAYFGHTSYRSYLDVFLIVFAALPLATLLSRIPGCAERLAR